MTLIKPNGENSILTIINLLLFLWKIGKNNLSSLCFQVHRWFSWRWNQRWRGANWSESSCSYNETNEKKATTVADPSNYLGGSTARILWSRFYSCELFYLAKNHFYHKVYPKKIDKQNTNFFWSEVSKISKHLKDLILRFSEGA